MENEELNQKLASLSCPEAELPSYRIKLRRFLLNRYPPERKREHVFFFWKSLSLSGCAFLLTLYLFNSWLFPQPDIALAREIALKDPRFVSLVEKGAFIQEAQLSGNKGYLLVSLGQAAQDMAFGPSVSPLASVFKIRPVTLTQSSFLVEVDFRQRKVAQLKPLEISNNIGSEEEQRLREMSQGNETVKKEIPEGAQIKEVKITSSRFKLVEKNQQIQAQPLNEALIIYQKGQQLWQVDMNGAKVEKIQLISAEEKH
jgi:hypothetical protein